jgi:hypothetical protein
MGRGGCGLYGAHCRQLSPRSLPGHLSVDEACNDQPIRYERSHSLLFLICLRCGQEVPQHQSVNDYCPAPSRVDISLRRAIAISVALTEALEVCLTEAIRVSLTQVIQVTITVAIPFRVVIPIPVPVPVPGSLRTSSLGTGIST